MPMKSITEVQLMFHEQMNSYYITKFVVQIRIVLFI